MVILLIFAFISGIITILSPCILPILPVVLAGGVGGGKKKSVGIVLGFVISFTLFTLTLTTIVQAFGISPDLLRFVAVFFIIMFGLILLIPPLHNLFGMLATRITSIGRNRKTAQTDSNKKSGISGFLSGLPIGFSLGLVWTPCAGPIMASVISLALTKSLDSGAILITLFYSLGTAVPMFGIMLTGRTLLNKVPFLVRNTEKIQRAFGVLMIVVALAIAFNWDRQFQTALLRIFPDYGFGLTQIENLAVVQKALRERENNTSKENSGEVNRRMVSNFSKQPRDGKLGDFGKAPFIVTDGPWLNTEHRLTMNELKGKVVLALFWTYSCINCIRTIPYLSDWYKKYHDNGFEIIGVHTPEFEFEKSQLNVKKAAKELGVIWPVVLDNEYRQWKAYSNRYWPAHYFIDTKGTIRYFHFGEGHYKESENVIRELLIEAGHEIKSMDSIAQEVNQAETPETYLGYSRGKKLIIPSQIARDRIKDYMPDLNLTNGEWTLKGRWHIAKDYIVPETKGELHLNFQARKVFLVIEPEGNSSHLKAELDGKPVPWTKDISNGVLTPVQSRLYEIVNLTDPGSHTLTLKVEGQLKLFAFTFG